MNEDIEIVKLNLAQNWDLLDSHWQERLIRIGFDKEEVLRQAKTALLC